MAQLETNLNRSEVTKLQIQDGLVDIRFKLNSRLDSKGYGAYTSRHEILGILEEEYDEVREAIRVDTQEGYDKYAKELLDVAVGALFGYICIVHKHITP